MSDLLTRLIAINAPADIVSEVALLIAEVQVLERRRRKDRERKAELSAEFRGTPQNSTPSADKGFPEVSPHTPLPNPSQIRSQRTREGWPEDFREQFWKKYPHKVGRPDALKKLDGVMRSGRATFAEVMAGLDRYIRDKPADRAWCNPATWVNQARWEDQPASSSAGPSHTPLTEGRTTWISDDDPRWPDLAARHERERGRKVSAQGTRAHSGLGWYFPNEWLEPVAA